MLELKVMVNDPEMPAKNKFRATTRTLENLTVRAEAGIYVLPFIFASEGQIQILVRSPSRRTESQLQRSELNVNFLCVSGKDRAFVLV